MSALGGTFLASQDPIGLMDWFEHRFTFKFDRHGDGGSCILPAGDGVMVFGIQQARDDAPTPPAGPVEKEPYGRQPMMLNVRVDSMDTVVAALTGAGDKVAGPETFEGLGQFAWTRSPDGHDIEIWQPV